MRFLKRVCLASETGLVSPLVASCAIDVDLRAVLETSGVFGQLAPAGYAVPFRPLVVLAVLQVLQKSATGVFRQLGRTPRMARHPAGILTWAQLRRMPGFSAKVMRVRSDLLTSVIGCAVLLVVIVVLVAPSHLSHSVVHSESGKGSPKFVGRE